MKKKENSFMWPQTDNKDRYCFLIRDVAVNSIILKRTNYQLLLWWDEFGWMYQVNFYSLQIAKLELEKISGLVVKKDNVNNLYYTETESTSNQNYDFEVEKIFFARLKWIRLQY